MGEIANDMISGTACDICGCYFEDPTKPQLFEHGYPVTCWDCWDEMTKKERK